MEVNYKVFPKLIYLWNSCLKIELKKFDRTIQIHFV